MQLKYPIALSKTLVGTLKVSISVQRETAVQASRQGIDAEELTNLIMQKLEEIGDYLGDHFGLTLED